MSADLQTQLKSLELMADWSKWLAAIDTAALAGLFALLVDERNCPLASYVVAAIAVAMLLLLLSLWGACQFLFSMPRVVLELRELAAGAVLDRKGERFHFSLRTYQQIQYVPLYFCAAALCALVWLFGDRAACAG